MCRRSWSSSANSRRPMPRWGRRQPHCQAARTCRRRCQCCRRRIVPQSHSQCPCRAAANMFRTRHRRQTPAPLRSRHRMRTRLQSLIQHSRGTLPRSSSRRSPGSPPCREAHHHRKESIRYCRSRCTRTQMQSFPRNREHRSQWSRSQRKHRAHRSLPQGRQDCKPKSRRRMENSQSDT